MGPTPIWNKTEEKKRGGALRAHELWGKDEIKKSVPPLIVRLTSHVKPKNKVFIWEDVHYRIHEKSPYTLPFERSCNTFRVRRMVFRLSQSESEAAFKPIAKPCVLYVYIIQWFV